MSEQANCDRNGHIYGHQAKCIFCGVARIENPPHGPVDERFMRHHYGAARGATDPAPSSSPEKPIRMWAMHCPFRKSGSPVLGTFGAREQAVVIMTAATWSELVRRVPALQTMEFEVGQWQE